MYATRSRISPAPTRSRSTPRLEGADRWASPSGRIRLELTLPSGAVWTTGPDDAADRITGPAGEYCRVFVQRLPLVKATGLRAEGSAAKDALQVARAYL